VTTRTKKPKKLTLKDAFAVEFEKRAAERRAREEAERKQQELDLAHAEELYEALAADAEFLDKRGLTVDRRRYTVSLDHPHFRIAAYFEGGRASVTSADKRTTAPGSAAPRKQESVDTVEDALRLMAQYLADETR
jgi:hypothetical protein